MRHTFIDNREASGDAGWFFWSAPRRCGAPLLCPLLAVAVMACTLVVGGADAARAQVRVDGSPDAVHVEARDVPLQEVLAALQAKFNLRCRTDDALETRKTGVFDGPLQRVTARILDGYDFAMTVTPRGIDVLVLTQDQSAGKTVVSAVPAVTTSNGAPVMTAAQANRYEREHSR
jgi:hypothetical protein